MTTITLDTDLLTPLAAYLRLREHGARVVPARVGRPGPARPLLARRLRRPARLVRGGRAARRARRRLPRLRPHREARADGAAARRPGPTCPRAASSSPTCSCASTTSPARPRSSRGDPATSRGGARARARSRPDEPRAGTARRSASPTAPSTSAASSACQEHIRRGDAFQIVLSQRAERDDVGSPLARLPRAAPHQPVAVPLPARARRARARRLVARDARQGRGQRARA